MLLSEKKYYKNTLFIASENKSVLPRHELTYDDYVIHAFPPYILFSSFMRNFSFSYNRRHFAFLFIIFFYSLLHFHTTHNFFVFYFSFYVYFVNFYEWKWVRERKECFYTKARRQASTDWQNTPRNYILWDIYWDIIFTSLILCFSILFSLLAFRLAPSLAHFSWYSKHLIWVSHRLFIYTAFIAFSLYLMDSLGAWEIRCNLTFFSLSTLFFCASKDVLCVE